MTVDMTAVERTNLRTALRFLRARCGGWKQLAKVLHVGPSTARNTTSPTLAFRVARLAGVGVDDVLTGRYPEAGTCAHCGHRKEVEAA